MSLLRTHVSSAAALSVCAVGSRLVSSHLDKTVRIWALPEVEVSTRTEHEIGNKADHHQITSMAMYDNMVVTGELSLSYYVGRTEV